MVKTPVNKTLNDVTIETIETHKKISNIELKKDLLNLKLYNSQYNTNSFYGNSFLYNFQLTNLLKCKRENGETIYDVFSDSEKKLKLIENTKKRDRGGRTASGNVFECFRINTGSIVMFKSTTSKYLYTKYKATSVLDPTAGWGGRMLGAWAKEIDYTGIDSNIEMKDAYDDMLSFIENDKKKQLFHSNNKLTMIWDDCLNVDFSKIDYDFVLTSPPYINLEIYEHMPLWKNDEYFYNDFLIPLWDKCVTSIKKGGHVCFNISPKMYEDAKKHGLTECNIEEDLLQQLGQQTGKKKQDKIYIWKC